MRIPYQPHRPKNRRSSWRYVDTDLTFMPHPLAWATGSSEAELTQYGRFPTLFLWAPYLQCCAAGTPKEQFWNLPVIKSD
jgi:hypothetical protein